MENKRKWIFIGYAVLVLLIPTYMITSSADILGNGKLYKFRMEGYDPFDFFRGNYLDVRINTDNIPTDKEDWKPGERVYLTIDVGSDGYAFFDEALEEPPNSGDYMVSRVDRVNRLSRDISSFFLRGLLGRRRDGRARTVDVEMPNNLGKYFINEDYALDGEHALRQRRNSSSLYVKVKNGNVRIQEIYVGKKPIMEYLEDGGNDESDREDIFLQF